MEPIVAKSPEPLPAVHSGAKEPIDYATLLFLVAALWFIPIGEATNTLSNFRIIFISIILEAVPFMLLGSLVGGLIEVFISSERMATMLPRKGWLTVCAAAGAGIVFPVCECAVVPVVRRLTGKGLPLSAAVAYLLGGPIVNPVVALSTILAYGLDWRMAALRLAAGYAIAVGIGLLMGWLFKKDSALVSGRPAADAACGCHHAPGNFAAACGCELHSLAPAAGWPARMGAVFRHAADDFMLVGHYLLIGAFIAALAQTFITRASFIHAMGYPPLAIAGMMTLAVLLNLCSEADAFIAASFRGLVPPAGQMAFMLVGPMFDLKLLLMYRGLFRTRAIVWLAALILIAVSAVSGVLAWAFAGVTI